MCWPSFLSSLLIVGKDRKRKSEKRSEHDRQTDSPIRQKRVLFPSLKAITTTTMTMTTKQQRTYTKTILNLQPLKQTYNNNISPFVLKYPTMTTTTTTTTTTRSPSSTSARKEHLYCLYGSQMGNSEQAAENFCKQLQTRYTTTFFEEHNLQPIEVTTTCIQLDDFLELRHAEYTKCIVIFVSSYGVGQAPLGAYKFRSLAEKLLERQDPTILKGLRYAICGLGMSFFKIQKKLDS